MKRALSILIGISVAASGIASPTHQNLDNTARITAQKKVAAMKDRDFCLALGTSIRATKQNQQSEYSRAMLDRAVKLEFLKPFEIEAIKTRSPAIGLSLCSVLAALGPATRNHQHTTSLGTSFQLVYVRGGKTLYLHLDFADKDFRVTSWRD